MDLRTRYSSILFGVTLILSSSLGVYGQDPVLQDYLSEAARSNPGLKAHYLNYLAALEKTPQVGTLPDPELSFGYFISPIETRIGAQEARISLMQMFPWVGTLAARKEASVANAKAMYEIFEMHKNMLYYEVKKTYYQLYELDQAIRITKENIEFLISYESLATKRFESGLKSGFVDVLRIQMSRAELNNSLLLLEDKRKAITTVFNNHLNRVQDTEVTTPGTLIPVQLEHSKTAVSDSILLGNNKLRSISLMHEAAQHEVSVARKQGMPSFGIGFNYIVVSKRTDLPVPDNGADAYFPMVSMSLPVYRGKYKAKVKAADLRMQSLESAAFEEGNTLRNRLEVAWVNYEDARRRLDLYQDQSKRAEQALAVLAESYTNAGNELEEVLRMQQLILTYDLELVKAARDVNTSVALIESLYNK